ncbi:MAG TPA: hypothetical protein GXX14_01865 [Clostridiaceae bacterium]|nr:hypothetical protein [Clostridiaceae bacterium]
MVETVLQVVDKYFKSERPKYRRFKRDMVERLFRGYTEKNIGKNRNKKSKAGNYAF